MNLNDQGEVIDPNVGDAELTRMEFDSTCAVLHFKLHNGHHFALRLDHVWWMSFSTSITQNVVHSINITNNTDKIDAPEYIRDMLLTRTLRIPGDTSKPEPLSVVEIIPAAGPKMICIATKVYAVPRVRLTSESSPRPALLPVESYIIERLEDGGWRVTERRADLTDIPVADFASLEDAEEWSNWRQGRPTANPYAK
jgi:hypothetical protein